MEVVIRTAHGRADVDLAGHDDETTLRDLLATVTGLAIPTVVAIDGRPCRVDDRIDDAIAEAGLSVGSVIDVASDRTVADPVEAIPQDADGAPAVVEVCQLSGRGTGEIVRLTAGTYRFGAGRRLVEQELSPAMVEEEAFTITVEPHERPVSPGAPVAADAMPTVTIAPGSALTGDLGPFTPTLGGQLLDRPLRWTDQRLSVGGRVFTLRRVGVRVDDETSTTIGAARIGDPGRDGVRSFDAAGTVAAGAGDVPPEAVLAALARLDDPPHRLWRRRPHDDRLAIPIGLAGDLCDVVSIDLDRHDGLAASGGAEFTAALARTVLVELGTMLGPGDLDVVIVTSTGRLGRWDWAKWLPHVRGGDPTAQPRFITTDRDAAAWRESNVDESAAGEGQGGHLLRRAGWARPAATSPTPGATDTARLPPPSGRPHARPSSELAPRRTLLVVDDAAHWMRRESPLRSLLVGPHSSIRVLALVDHPDDAPGICTAVIDEIPPHELVAAGRPDGATGSEPATRLFGSLGRLVEQLGSSPIVTEDVRPALLQLPAATRLALGVASLDDLRVHRHDPAPSAPRSDRPAIGDLLALVGVRSADAGERSRTEVPIGRVASSPVAPAPVDANDAAMIDVAAARVTGIAADDIDAQQVLGAVALGVAARHRPDELAVLLVTDAEARWIEPLPHLIGSIDGRDVEQLGRVLRRVATTLGADRRFELLVIVEGGLRDEDGATLTDATLAFLELARSLDQVHLVVSCPIEQASALRDGLGAECGVFVEGRRDGTATLTRRHDQLDVGTASIVPTFDLLLPVAQTPPPAPTAGLRVHPFVFGRPMSPIERRLARRNDGLRSAARSTNGGEPLTPRGVPVAAVPDPTDDAPVRPDRLLPPPFPDRVGQETLFGSTDERHRGMLPLGIVERADDPGLDVLRWTPDAGSLVGIGHRRSGMGTMVELVAAALPGIDADVWVLDPLPQRRRAFRRLPHCRKTSDPDSAAAVERFLTEVEREVDARLRLEDGRARSDDGRVEELAAAIRGRPRSIVVVIADLNRTLACVRDEDADEVITRIASSHAVAPTER